MHKEILYDAALGGTPDTQGKLRYHASPEAVASQRYADGATTPSTRWRLWPMRPAICSTRAFGWCSTARPAASCVSHSSCSTRTTPRAIRMATAWATGPASA